jgi:hypothetical protein
MGTVPNELKSHRRSASRNGTIVSAAALPIPNTDAAESTTVTAPNVPTRVCAFEDSPSEWEWILTAGTNFKRVRVENPSEFRRGAALFDL